MSFNPWSLPLESQQSGRDSQFLLGAPPEFRLRSAWLQVQPFYGTPRKGTMAGPFSGELFGLSCVCCIVVALMCLCSGFPGQPTPEPHVLLRHSRFRLQALHHLLQVQAWACLVGSPTGWPLVLTWDSLRSCYHPHMEGCSPSVPSVGAVRILPLQSACLLLCSLMGAPLFRSQRSAVWAVAAVAVIFVLRKCSDHEGYEVNVGLGQLKPGGETLCLQVWLV